MRRAHRGLLALAYVGALVLCGGRAARADVVWRGAPCGSTTTTPEGDEPQVDIDVVQRGAEWAATLTARYSSGAAGTRYITAPSCAELERAVEVFLSLLEPGALDLARESDADVAPRNTAPPDPPGNDRAATTVNPSPAPVDTGVSSERDPRAQATRGFVRLAALVGSGGGRFAELGAALSGGLWLGRWGGRVEVSARKPPAAISAEQDISLELTRLAAALDLCGRSGAWLEWGLCAGPRLELVSGLASGPSDPESDRVLLPGMGLAGFVHVPLAPRWALASELQGSWALRGAEAAVRPWGRVYDLPRVGVNLLVGIRWEPF